MIAEKKAVLNVTVAESIAAAARDKARELGTTVSSVVEEALAEQLKWFKIRQEGLAAMAEYFDEHGWPTAEQWAAADARIAEEDRLVEEARQRRAAKQQARVSGGMG
jgi:post-segregation antitoxin (ccd killing protein)